MWELIQPQQNKSCESQKYKCFVAAVLYSVILRLQPKYFVFWWHSYKLWKIFGEMEVVKKTTKQYDRPSRGRFLFKRGSDWAHYDGIVSRIISKYLQVAARPPQDEIWLIGLQIIVFDSIQSCQQMHPGWMITIPFWNSVKPQPCVRTLDGILGFALPFDSLPLSHTFPGEQTGTVVHAHQMWGRFSSHQTPALFERAPLKYYVNPSHQEQPCLSLKLALVK